MTTQLRTAALNVSFLAVLTSSIALAQLGPGAAPQDSGELVIIPFTPSSVRVLGTVESAVFVCSPFGMDEVLQLERLVVLSGGDVIHQQSLDLRLLGDPRFTEVNKLIERLPGEVTESRGGRRYFAKGTDAEFSGDEALRYRQEALVAWDSLSQEYAAGRSRPFAQINFPVHTDQVFFENGAAGVSREIEVRLTYIQPDGTRRTSAQSRSVRRLGDRLELPLVNELQGSSIHSGDLHVHSCHGEAAGACSPSSNCTAESLQLSGSFSYAQLRSQYEGLGVDWIAGTDHSYCINSAGEFAAIQAECAAATDASFLCVPDIELSSDEEGSQTGGDLGDVLCFGLTSANHMGAHGIDARISGGDDDLLGFCDGLFSDALNSFSSNIALIRSMGGYPIANHPAAGEFGWNSYASAAGIEAGGLHGVEVWNGVSQSGQGGHVGRWVSWLLDGRLLYAYSGSDTHDEAFSAGTNNVVFSGQGFTIDNLHAALRGGQHYLSNGHVLIIDAQLGGSVIPMGSMVNLPPSTPASAYDVRVHYNFGADTSTITIYAGKAWENSETILCQSGPLSGQGTFSCASTLVTSSNSWIRAYSEGGAMTAYTNPVFFLPTTEDPGAYCSAKLSSAGCEAQIGFSGTASAASPSAFNITASDVINQRMGLLFYGQAPAFTPFADGTLCVQGPLKRTLPQGSGGNLGAPDCSGSYTFDFNGYMQSGVDGALMVGSQVFAQFWYRDPAAASGSGLSNALYFSIGP